MNYISNITRSPGDPKVLQSGPSSLGAADYGARALGWFSYGLGLAELLAPRFFTRALGMQGNEALVRAYGAREIASGALTLSLEKDVGLWSRVAGDGLDIATVFTALRPGNPKKGNVVLALAMLAGITALDVMNAQAVAVRHARKGSGARRQLHDRSGFPQGLEKARGAAREMARPNGGTKLREVTG
jgi:hypothetical protein